MLTSKQRAQLRGLGNTLDPIFQVGKGGVNDQLIRQLDETLEVRELLKVRVLETAPKNVRTVADGVAAELGADVVQVIGKVFLLYRPSKDDPKIRLVRK